MEERKKRLTLLWRKLNSLEFGKDVVLVPYYLGQALDYDVEICCGYSEEVARLLPSMTKKGLIFTKQALGHNPYRRILVYIKYLLQNATCWCAFTGSWRHTSTSCFTNF